MKRQNLIALALVAGTATAAFAQPAVFTDLGDRSASVLQTTTPVTITSATDIQWFKVILPAVSNATASWVDMWTTPMSNPQAATDMQDSELGVYSNTGALVANDDDSGPGNYSQRSWGSTTSRGATTFPGLSNGATRAGAQGALAAGTYWIAVGHYNMTFGGTAWNVTTNNTSATEANCNLIIDVSPPTAPVPPSVSGGASSVAFGLSGYSTVLTVTVATGLNPVSPITSVVSDLSSIGDSATAAFHDDGLNGDAVAGNGVYSYAVASVTGTGGVHNVTVTATDGQARTGSGTIPVSIVTDLGDFSSGPHSASTTVTEATVANWFKVVLPAVTGAGSGYVDIWCEPTSGYGVPVAAGDSVDPDLALYDAAGNVIKTDDLDGPGFWAQMSFGSTVSRGTTPVWGTAAAGVARNGYDGNLAGGVYYIAQGHYNMATSANGFAPVMGAPGGNTVVKIETLDNTSPTNPVLSAQAATPSSGYSGTPVVIRVTVEPGTNPASTGLAVTADLTALGGSATAAMHDDGLNGDVTAADGIYSVSSSIPPGALDTSVYTVTIDAVDAESRHAAQVSVTLNGQSPVDWDEAVNGGGDAGQTIATAQVPVGTGAFATIVGAYGANDVDIYAIRVCDAASFSASTQFSSTLIDSQIFLFTTDGHGVSHNDDFVAGGAYAKIDNTGVTDNTNYFIAVSRYNIDPVDAAAALIWNNTDTGGGFTGTRIPDGPGAANVLDSWTGTNGTAATYKLTMTGVCFVPPAQCSPADVGVQGGLPGHDNTLNNNDFIVFIDLFIAHDPAADLGIQGGDHGSDGEWNNNDFISFIDYFFDDAVNCTGQP